MKRLLIFLSILFLLSPVIACQPSAPSLPPEPSFEPLAPLPLLPPQPPAQPPEPEEMPENLGSIPGQLLGLNEDLQDFMAKYPTFSYDSRVAHRFIFEGGRHIFTQTPAVNISEAKTHLFNAYYLANKNRLPSEIMPRDVTRDEIALELNRAIILLQQQLSHSYSYEEDTIKWAKESSNPTMSNEFTIRSIAELYDEYREDLSRLITLIELTLSILLKDH